ncbi:MAG: hypothetical protein JXA10_02510, partial [Anaerolineae bacterium]|nr:hypothetical protein [Anaerolineae bacterium]
MRLIDWPRGKLDTPNPLFTLFLTIGVGVMAGVMGIMTYQSSAKWKMVLLLIAAAPAVILVVNDIKKLILIAIVVDIPLGLDIAIPDLEWHQGGPNGYMISLMTIGLVAGYAQWILERKPKVRFFPQTSIPILIYLLMVILSFYQARNIQLSSFGLFLLCEFILMYFYIANHVLTWGTIRLIMSAIVVSMLFESLLMVFQYFTGFSFSLGPIVSNAYDEGVSAGAVGFRVGGTIGQPNAAATY